MKNERKILSVFLSALMLLSVLVFVAPQKASAESDRYHVKIEINTIDEFSNRDTNIYLYYKSGNGTNSYEREWSQRIEDKWDGFNDDRRTTVVYDQYIDGFPTRVSVSGERSSALFPFSTGEFEIRVFCNDTLIAYADSGEIKKGKEFECIATVESSNYPRPNSASWNAGSINVTVPDAVGDRMTYTLPEIKVVDQYGVLWANCSTMSYTFSQSPTGVTINNSNPATLTVTGSAKSWVKSSGTNSKQINLYANISSSNGSTRSNTIPLVFTMEEHSFNRKYVYPTCTVEGETYLECYKCGEKQARQVIPAIGHELQNIVIASTCTTAGESYDKCVNCNEIFNRTALPLAEHVLQPVIATESTCTREGDPLQMTLTQDDIFILGMLNLAERIGI